MQTQQYKQQDKKKYLEKLIIERDKIRQINRDVRDLLEMTKDMDSLVNQQQETIDEIQFHVEIAKEKTEEACKDLEMAMKYRTGIYIKGAIIGGILGTLAGGPVGMIVGGGIKTVIGCCVIGTSVGVVKS